MFAIYNEKSSLVEASNLYKLRTTTDELPE